MAKETEKLPILLQDGTEVKVGIKVYRVRERNMYDPRYDSRNRRSKRAEQISYPKWSGELNHIIYTDEVIKVNEGFNSRTFVTRDKKGIEHSFTVNHYTSTRRYDPTDMLFGTLKAAKQYVKDKNQEDMEFIKKKVAKYTERLSMFKQAEKKLKSNLSSLR